MLYLNINFDVIMVIVIIIRNQKRMIVAKPAKTDAKTITI